LIYGVCGWGLLTGLVWGVAMALIFSVPSFLLLRALGRQLSNPDLQFLFGFPLILGMIGFAFGGVAWGRALWEVVSSQPPEPPEDGASHWAPLRPIPPLIQSAVPIRGSRGPGR
jgi:hypothetical protein